MYISSFSIRNFRNFKNAKFHFQKGINTILGENGSGKTNIFYALRLLIDDSLPRFIHLYESDFNRKLGQWVGHWIILSAEFAELDSAEEIQVLATHSIGAMDGSSTGRYTMFFRPKIEFRRKLFEYSSDENKDQNGLAELLSDLTIDDYETVFLGRGTVDFNDEEDYLKYVGDFEQIEFPDPDDSNSNVYGSRIPSGISIPLEVSCTYVKALRDVEGDLYSFNKNPLIGLLRGQEKTIRIEDKDEILSQIETLNGQITNLKEVREINFGVDKCIKEAVGSTYAPNIEIKSELPSDIEKLFQSLKLWVGDPDEDGYKGKLWELSLGGLNLIFLSLKLLEYERVKSTDRAANFLLIEEPEAHIHTHIQKNLFNNLQQKKTQVIISTHSTHISSVSKISSVNVLCRANKESLVFQPSNGLKKEQLTRLERYLDAVRSTLLFAKGVILVEGDAEYILIPEMFKKVFGITLDEIGISIVNIGSTGFKNVAILFHPKRIEKYCAIVTDLDKSILPLGNDPSKDSAEEKSCRNSQSSGLKRKEALKKLCKSNPYLKPFYAEYTFEVDFVSNDNDWEIEQVIKQIYTDERAKEVSIEKIEDSNIAIKGKEVLRLANRLGKGWFAIRVAENLLYYTYIPDYILRAISFAAPAIPQDTIINMISYRLNKLKSSSKEDNEISKIDALILQIESKSIPQAELIQAYKDTYPDDQLTKLLSLNEKSKTVKRRAKASS